MPFVRGTAAALGIKEQLKMTFEPVYDVSEYYDGPRCGIASFNGVRHRFRSRYLDAIQYKGDFESVDLFELIPVESSSDQEVVLATATFRPVANQAELKPGQLRLLEVAWHRCRTSPNRPLRPIARGRAPAERRRYGWE